MYTLTLAITDGLWTCPRGTFCYLYIDFDMPRGSGTGYLDDC